MKHWSVNTRVLEKTQKHWPCGSLEMLSILEFATAKIKRQDLITYWDKLDLDPHKKVSFPHTIAMTFVLSDNQRTLLKLSEDARICQIFYLSGGTASWNFIWQHRLSEDLTFFRRRIWTGRHLCSIEKIQNAAGITSVRYEQSFNRNLFFLELEKDEIKTEFTYFPFPRIEQKKSLVTCILIVLIDIAVNKYLPSIKKPRSRDFIDLYCILKENHGLYPTS